MQRLEITGWRPSRRSKAIWVSGRRGERSRADRSRGSAGDGQEQLVIIESVPAPAPAAALSSAGSCLVAPSVVRSRETARPNIVIDYVIDGPARQKEPVPAWRCGVQFRRARNMHAQSCCWRCSNWPLRPFHPPERVSPPSLAQRTVSRECPHPRTRGATHTQLINGSGARLTLSTSVSTAACARSSRNPPNTQSV